MKIPKVSWILITLIIVWSSLEVAHSNTIAFATLGRSSYAFDIFALPTAAQPSPTERRLTDGDSVNFNGQFPTNSSRRLVYVTERNGSSSIYLDTVGGDYDHDDDDAVAPFIKSPGIRSVLESGKPSRDQVLLVGDEQVNARGSMKDKPNLVEDTLIYTSTHEDSGVARQSWSAVYSTRIIEVGSTQVRIGQTRRLTPAGTADFSPAVSPSGRWTAVASFGPKGWSGEVQELKTDIYVFSTRDGTGRVKVVDHGGWPSWAGDSTFYFHRKCDDGWWSVFRADFRVINGRVDPDTVSTRRVTPEGFHAFTPSASAGNDRVIAIATRRATSEYRHVELYDVVSNKPVELTRLVNPNTHHYNPFLSPDGKWVGYHRCRGANNDGQNDNFVLENVKSPFPGFSLFRLDGSFPSYSPDGKRLAFVRLPGLYVMNSDGSGLRPIYNGTAFSTSWDWKRKGIVYTSLGPTFASADTKVDIVSINVDDENLTFKKLTHGGENNAFPSPSPDGKWVVFRSGRSGHKNLYIMDALNGERSAIFRLTRGPWSDTMCNWSPDGEWIAFASDRADPGSGSFELFKIHPNGTGLQKVVQSGSGGRTNHPWFSPDGKYIVLTSDYAGVSAEPISNPHHYQPYGDIFVVRSDGSGMRRLTHNSYEDGTPAWSPRFAGRPSNVEWPDGRGSKCSFSDCSWLRPAGARLARSDRYGSESVRCGP